MKSLKDFLEESVDHDYIQNHLLNHDIDSSIKDGKVVVAGENVSSAKKHLKKIGYGHLKVVKEEVEELDEIAGAGISSKDLHKHLKGLGWALTRTKGRHDVYEHPNAKHNIPVPRHKGDLSAPTVLDILKKSKQLEEQTEETMEDIQEGKSSADYKVGKDGRKHPASRLTFKNHIKTQKERKAAAARKVNEEVETLEEMALDRKTVKGHTLELHHEIDGTRSIYKRHKNNKVSLIRNGESMKMSALWKNLHEEVEPLDITAESFELDESLEDGDYLVERMVDEKTFNDILDAHRKAGNRIRDAKHSGKTATYTVIDKDGYGKKHTYTDSNRKVQSLGKIDTGEESEESRGRGRPEGSKSGAKTGGSGKKSYGGIHFHTLNNN